MKHIYRQAQEWNAWACQNSRLHKETIAKKTLDSISFCIGKRTKGFAIPTKLVALDKNLWRFKREYKGGFVALETYICEDGSVDVFYPQSSIKMGKIQPKHKWLTPLLLSETPPSVHLLEITGGTDGKCLGVNVVIGNFNFNQ